MKQEKHTFDKTMSNCSSVIISASWSLIDKAAIQENCLKADAPWIHSKSNAIPFA